MAERGRPPFVLTPEKRERVIAAVRMGMNYTRAAYLVGCSRDTFFNLRVADPSLDQAIAQALSEWDEEHMRIQADMLASGDSQGAERVAKIRSNRLPQWYSPKIEMRRDHEMHVPDEDNTPAASSGIDLGDAISALIAAKKSGAL